MSNTPSQPTQSTPYFAQEIIDIIMGALSSDVATLTQCSTVSRSFHLSSRRYLFCVIELKTIQMVVRLHRLLISSPDIAPNIQKLEVGLSCYQGKIDEDGNSVDVKDWLRSSTLMANVLEILPCVQTFVWRSSFNWDKVSSELQSALVKLFQSPSLTTIAISYVMGLPLSAFHIISPVKRLELYSTQLQNGDQMEITLPHLEVLMIHGRGLHLEEEFQLIVPNLLRISLMEDDGDEPHALAQHAIDASRSSLQRLWWNYNLKRANHINLQGLLCLQFLTIVVHPVYRTSFGDWGRNFHITSPLKDISVMQTLKDLTIGVVYGRSNLVDSDWQDLYNSKIWKDLDFILSSILMLKRVLIHFYFIGYQTIPAQVWVALRKSMPYLEERGILMFKSGVDTFPKQDIFTF